MTTTTRTITIPSQLDPVAVFGPVDVTGYTAKNQFKIQFVIIDNPFFISTAVNGKLSRCISSQSLTT